MLRLGFTSAARRDLVAIETYIAEHAGEAVADTFLAGLHDLCVRVASLPGLLGTARPDLAPDLRSTPHRNYVVYFRYVDKTLEVVAVLHGKRDARAYFGDDEDT